MEKLTILLYHIHVVRGNKIIIAWGPVPDAFRETLCDPELVRMSLNALRSFVFGNAMSDCMLEHWTEGVKFFSKIQSIYDLNQ